MVCVYLNTGKTEVKKKKGPRLRRLENRRAQAGMEWLKERVYGRGLNWPNLGGWRWTATKKGKEGSSWGSKKFE